MLLRSAAFFGRPLLDSLRDEGSNSLPKGVGGACIFPISPRSPGYKGLALNTAQYGLLGPIRVYRVESGLLGEPSSRVRSPHLAGDIVPA